MTATTGVHLGLVGAGRIGAMHARNLAALPGAGRLTIADADPASARRVADELGVRHAADVAELLGSGIDALVIAAATDAHADLIVAGIDAGLPVFCEKPVAGEVKGTIRVRGRG